MGVEMVPGSHVLGMWFVFDHQEKDWMCTVSQKERGEPWVMDYRFRYYVDDKVHGSEDKKNFYRMQFKVDTPKAVMIEAAKAMQHLLLTTGFGDDTFDLLIDSRDPEVIMAKQKTCPFLHMVEIKSAEDAEEAGYTDIAAEWRKTGKCPLGETG